MEHGNRIKLVRGIHIRILKKYKESILFGGVYGSTASGRDTEFSDIEMLYIVNEQTPACRYSFLYRGIPVEADIIPVSDVLNWMQDVELTLPFKMGNLEGLQLLAGDNRQKQAVLEQYKELTEERIHLFFLKHGAEIAYESFNKIRSLARRAARQDLALYVFEMVQEISLALALVNRKPIRKGYLAGVKESFEFELLPDDYKQTVESLIKSASFTEAIESGRKLIASYEEFLNAREIPTRNLLTLDEIVW